MALEVFSSLSDSLLQCEEEERHHFWEDYVSGKGGCVLNEIQISICIPGVLAVLCLVGISKTSE